MTIHPLDVLREDTLRSLLARYPATTRAIEDLARAYIGEHRNEEALGFLHSEVARHPARQDVLFAFVDGAVELHTYDPAIAALHSTTQI